MHFNRTFCLITAGLLIAACNNPTTVTQTIKTDTVTVNNAYIPDTTAGDNDQYEDFYITIVDTGNDYYRLDAAMYALGKASNISVDTMNRYYNQKKKDIVVREDDEDEMYRGEYYARRYDDTTALSLEHANEYIEHASPKSFAVLAAICDRKSAADSALARILPFAPKAFVVKARLYIGCMH